MKNPILKVTLSLVLLTGLFFTPRAGAQLRLPSLVGNNMVLQQNTEVTLWGWADPGARVAVTPSWTGGRLAATAGVSGEWEVKVKTPPAGGPHTIQVSSGRQSVLLENVLSGEVWLCSGQSNMDMPVMGYHSQPVAGSMEALLDADAYDGIRLFKVPYVTALSPGDDVEARWEVSGMNTAAGFSAVGYYFARILHRNLGVPVGIIQSAWGGTRIQAWTSAETIERVTGEKFNRDRSGPNSVSVLYNGMIHPLGNYTLKGFIWYQGETNVGQHAIYDRLMEGMVTDWRNLWGDPEAPFYYVQLAPFDYYRGMEDPRAFAIRLPLLVESQLRALDLIPRSGMAASTDAGDSLNIHPPRKDLIARRLALLALDGTYGRSAIGSMGPRYEGVDFRDGRAYVRFESPSTLAPAFDSELAGFEIAGADRVFRPARAVVEGTYHNYGRVVEVWSPEVPEPVAVRYAFSNVVPRATLTDTMGLPAYPFRTDDWDDVW